MKKSRVLLLVAVALALLVSLPTYAQDDPRGSITYLAEDGSTVSGYRCGTVDGPPPDVLEAMKGIDRWRQENDVQAGANIPVAFHVITSSSGAGDVPDAQIQDQIDVLNGAYAGTGFSFFLSSVDRTQNDQWFRTSGGRAEWQMKYTLAIDPTHTLNFYTNSPLGGVLGWATFPWMYPEDHFMHGVVVLYSSLPGGSAYPYNEGDTGTHEVGHYLGLFHTFEGGCRPPGDYLWDTPFERSPASGCPVGRDTCSRWPGLDPINNFMDYSDDACMTEFTPHQGLMMDWAVTNFRPGLLNLSGMATLLD